MFAEKQQVLDKTQKWEIMFLSVLRLRSHKHDKNVCLDLSPYEHYGNRTRYLLSSKQDLDIEVKELNLKLT